MNPPRKIELTVQTDEDGLRIDKVLHQRLGEYSRTYYQKLIKQEQVRLDDQTVKVSDKVSVGQRICLIIPEPQTVEIKAENIPLNIIYEDVDIIVIDKAAGLVVHPGAGIRSGTLVNALLYHCKDLSGIGGRLRPGIVHRLDKNTSGLIVAAKNDKAHLNLSKQLMEKTMIRTYHALVWHQLTDKEGFIETYLARSKRNRMIFVVANSGKKAITHYKVMKNFDFLSWLELRLETGRTHQIRSQLNYLHHPVFGDPDYNGRSSQFGQLGKQSRRIFAKELLNKISRQALHARHLSLHHPADCREMQFESDYPEDIKIVLQTLEKSAA
jgi:23S rRNA pseudouridine1911/1915/1917 synthase